MANSSNVVASAHTMATRQAPKRRVTAGMNGAVTMMPSGVMAVFTPIRVLDTP